MVDADPSALGLSLDAAAGGNEGDAVVMPGANLTAADVEPGASQVSVTPAGCVECAHRQHEPMPAEKRAQRVRRQQALLCEGFDVTPDEDSAPVPPSK